MLITIFTVTTALPVYAMNPGANGPGEPTVGEQYFHSDHLGNHALITDQSGNIKTRTLYDSYGKVLGQSHGSDNFREKWAGATHLKHDNGNLRMMGSRVYDMDARRFLSPDPKNVFHSPYRYSSDPIQESDPSGEEPFTIACIIIFAIVGLFTVGYAVSGTMKFWEWDAETWAWALLGAVAAAAFAAAAAAALPAIAAACATACPGVAAALGGTTAGVFGASATVAAATTTSAVLTKVAISAVVFGTIGAVEGATMAMITQGGIASKTGRPMRWDKVGKAAYMGAVYGAAGTIAGAAMNALASGVSKGMSHAFNKFTNGATKVGNTKFARKIAPGMRALAGKHAGKGYGAADDIAGSWKRFSMYGVTKEAKLYQVGASLRGAYGKVATHVAGHAGVYKSMALAVEGGLAVCAVSSPGCGSIIKWMGAAGYSAQVNKYSSNMTGTAFWGRGGVTGYAEPFENAYDGTTNSGGGDFGLIGCDESDPTCAQ